MKTESTTHKAHDGDRGDHIDPDSLRPLHPENPVDSTHNGGLFRKVGGILIALMPNLYRPGQTGDVRGGDFHKLNLGNPDRVFPEPESMRETLSGTGSEYELHAVRLRRRSRAARTATHARPSSAIGLIDRLKQKFASQSDDNKSASHELWRSMVEVGTKGRVPNLQEHRRLSRELLMQTIQEAEQNGFFFYPGSTAPIREYRVSSEDDEEGDDLNPNSYIQQLAYKILGLLKVRRFTGMGFQVHKEFNNARTATFALIHGEHVMSVIQSLTTSSSADQGEVEIDASTSFQHANDAIAEDGKLAEFLPAGKSRWHSLRRMHQEFSLTTGGSLKFLPPIEALYDKSMTALVGFFDQRSRTELVSRAFGGHTSRIRTDAPGTIEVTHFDTAGYRLQRTDMLVEMTQKLYTALEWLADAPPMQQQAIFRKFNLLFPAQPLRTQEEMQTYIQENRYNMLRMARDAQHSKVTVPGGDQEASVQGVMEQFAAFLNDLDIPLSHESQAEVARALLDPPTDATFEDFYSSGRGNFSQYFLIRYDAHKEAGASHKEALKRVVAEASIAFHKHVRSEYALAT